MADQPAIGDVVRDITADIRTIVRGEINLAKAEVLPGAKKAGLGAGLFGAAAVFGVIALNTLFVCLGFVFTHLFWGDGSAPIKAFALGFLCAVGVYLLIAAILALVGLVNVKKLKKPEAAIQQADQSVTAVKAAVGGGLQNVKMISTRGKKLIKKDDRGQIVTVYAGQPDKVDRSLH